LIVIVLARSSYVGFSKGFGGEGFRCLCYVGAVIGAVYYYEAASQLISDYLPALYPVSTLIGFTGIYFIVLIVTKLITVLIDKIIKIEAVNAVNKTGGLLFGFGRGVILLSLLLISLIMTPVPYFEKSIKERSYLGRITAGAAPFIYEKAALIFPVLNSGTRNEALKALTRRS
jgi:membrane protein required for colicin V production